MSKSGFFEKIILRSFVAVFITLFMVSCKNVSKTKPIVPTVPPVLINKNVTSILQDRDSNYWFGTDGSGVYHYDGNDLILFSSKNGLCNDQIRTVQEDNSGNIWFGTADGISSYDGRMFTTFPSKELTIPADTVPDWNTEPTDLWFAIGGGVYRLRNDSLIYFPVPDFRDLSNTAKTPSNSIDYFTVYSTLMDRSGNVWLGTQTLGVCKINSMSTGENEVVWFSEKGLSGPAALALFEDKSGNLWFGNNGYGVFKYDGTTLRNITEENGLINESFFTNSYITKDPEVGTMGRIYCINEDDNGNIWIGTIDSGVWRYNGEKLTNFTIDHGLPDNSVNCIYKDKTGELWFGTVGGLCKFNGVSFIAF